MDVVQEDINVSCSAKSAYTSAPAKLKANQCPSPRQHKRRSLPLLNNKKTTLAVPALCCDDGESDIDFESEDDGFDHPHLPRPEPMDLDLDADGEPDMEDDSEVDEEPKKGEQQNQQHQPNQPLPPPSSVQFDDDGESEIDEVDSEEQEQEEQEQEEEEEEPEIPLASLRVAPPPPLPYSLPYLHVSHRLFPGHNRPFGELTPTGSSTVFAKETHPGSPFVPYARLQPPPYAHGIIQRAWHVPEQGVMRTTKLAKRRDRAVVYGEAVILSASPQSQGHAISHQPTPGDTLPRYYNYQSPSPVVVEEKPRRVIRRPYPCLYKDCTLAFPSPKDRGRHMDKHFEGRFECMRCHKRYARVDALKRHCSEMFKSRKSEASARSYAPTASCVGAFEAKEWKEVSESLWLKHEHVLNLRLPDPQDPLYSQISRLLHEARYSTSCFSFLFVVVAHT